MRKVLLAASAFLICLSGQSWADIVRCTDIDVTVNSDSVALAQEVCTAAVQAQTQFQQCNLGSTSNPLRVDIVETLPDSCVGLYHCQQDWIELLAPSLMQTLRKEDGAFHFLSETAYFRSVVVHELAHAAFDKERCPFDGCVVGNEYVAYAMQVMSLSADDRSAFEVHAGLNRRVSVVELTRLLLDLAPERFAARAWTHLQQRDDPCGYIGEIVSGAVLLDRERF